MTKLFLCNLVPEIKPMTQNGLSTAKSDLLHLYVIGLAAMAQKSQRVLKH